MKIDGYRITGGKPEIVDGKPVVNLGVNACSLNITDGEFCMSEKATKLLSSKNVKLPKGKTVDEYLAFRSAEKHFTPDEFDQEMKRYKPLGRIDDGYFSNFVTDNTLKMYSEYDSNFYEISAQLMDFPSPTQQFSPLLRDAFIEGTDSYILDRVKSGDITTIGIVLNTLKSTGNLRAVGHWVSMFIDFRSEPGTIEYFNSSGRAPIPEVDEWMKKTADDLTKKLGKKIIPVHTSSIVHQKSDTECGAYSLYYILARLLGYGYKQFRKNRISDESVMQFRSKILIDENVMTAAGLMKSRF